MSASRLLTVSNDRVSARLLATLGTTTGDDTKGEEMTEDDRRGADTTEDAQGDGRMLEPQPHGDGRIPGLMMGLATGDTKRTEKAH